MAAAPLNMILIWIRCLHKEQTVGEKTFCLCKLRNIPEINNEVGLFHYKCIKGEMRMPQVNKVYFPPKGKFTWNAFKEFEFLYI